MVHIVDHHPDKQVLATGKSGGSFPCLYSNNSTENHLNSLRFDSLEAASDAAFQLVFPQIHPMAAKRFGSSVTPELYPGIPR